MKISKAKKLALAAICGFGVIAPPAFAYNPISTYHYLADPGAAADDDYFYVITDSDDPAPYNSDGYQIKALYGFRTRDMQNWTDFGIIYDARKVDGIGDIWASGIAKNPNDGRLYIVFPDGGGGGIGLIGADSIAGPWTNPVSGGKKLINNWGGGIDNCDNIGWCFDPAIFFDDDGQGYFTFGGGSSDQRPANNDNNDIFNIYKLSKDMKGFDTSSKTHLKIGGPKAMEASYIHKYKGNYYLSYSTADLRIAYGMATSPMGPYTYKGIFMGNPNIDGQNINANNNNHHGIAEFKGHWYVAYHDRRIANGYDGLEKIPAEDGKANPNAAYHRSVSVDEFYYNADGTMKSLTFTKEGPDQIENFDPYDWYPALTSSKQKGIRSRSNWAPGRVAESYLLPLSTKESWIRVSGVDFGTAATGFTVEAASIADGNKIEIHTGSPTGALAGTCALKNTGSKSTFAETSCDMEGLKGIVDYVFMVFKGSQDSTMAIKAWGFQGSGTTPPEPQKAYNATNTPWAIPGVIQMEDFDVPGVGRGGDLKSFQDNDSENHGNSDYRKDDAPSVDLYKKSGDRIVVGYIQKDEWLEYTVNVAETGTYTMYAAVASDGGSSFKLSMDGKDITEDVKVPAAKKEEGEEQNFDDYAKVSANVNLTKGEHILRFTATADWFDIDYVNFESGENAPDKNPLGTDAIAQKMNLQMEGKNVFNVFDLRGKKLGQVDIFGKNTVKALNEAGFAKGVYMLVQVGGAKKMMVNSAK
ncbi:MULTISPECIES: carbohydrate-binding protein [unclassified Fibrobacter]|uniref:carbohydrate-binding protein n=1 Tax=unclassified Fibrobacter TaxID=2634177 RepID=UPI000D795218|nr:MULTISPECIES: carbohydrate-binding protein [unclassified Fibrobacter]PWJ71708.1 carbohydrate binding protein with CBM6 domain [Fibrobacter sp. UWR4]PZW74067.1 carbohydrate binding protein with CBM6 domain [Fibrobacter sp. UWR1]